MVFSNAMGQYDLRVLYHALPGLNSTTMVESFQGV